jgi:hypothetical protein
MRWIFVVAALSLTACGGGGDAKIKEFEGFRDRMCECKDATCANKILDEWREWRKGTTDLKPSDDQAKRIKEIDHAFHDCEHKVGGGTP